MTAPRQENLKGSNNNATHQKRAFDEFADSYTDVLDRQLPGGMTSEDFRVQKAVQTLSWSQRLLGTKSPRVLDYGCGPGEFAFDLFQLSRPTSYVGIDESEESLKTARERLGERSAKFYASVDAATGEFDLITAYNVYHHVKPADRVEETKKLVARLAPGGIFCLWEHNPFNPLTQAFVMYCDLDVGVSLLRPSRARRLFTDAGLSLVESNYVNVTPPKWQRRRVFKKLDARLQGLPFGTQYTAVFRNA